MNHGAGKTGARVLGSSGSKISVLPTPDNTNWTVTIANDGAATAYKGDKALGLKYSVKIPMGAPAGGRLKLTNTNNIENTSLCSMYNPTATKASIGCIVTGGSADCNLKYYGDIAAARTVDICCYNSKSNTTKVQATGILYSDKGTTILSQLTTASPTTGFVSEGSILANTLAAAVTRITFTQTNQLGGLAKAFVTIDLKRPVVRNQTTEITGALKNMYIGATANCAFTYTDSTDYANMRVGANWDQGDFLVDTCTMAGDGDAHVITLQNKNVVYKCGLSLVKTVVVMLWPVKAYQFSALDHTVVSKVGANILVKSTYTTKPKFPATTFVASPYIILAANATDAGKLCALTTLSPNVVGLNGQYSFTVDTAKLPTDITKDTVSRVANEVSIYFPENHFGEMPMVTCATGVAAETPLMCSWNGPFLNVFMDKDLAANTKTLVHVSGITTPVLGASGNTDFQCTVNWYDVHTSLRQNLMVGSGSNAIQTYGTTHGNLRFISSGATVPTLIPRTGATNFEIQWTVDTSLALNTLPTEFKATTALNNPILYVDFPSSFWLSNKVGAVLESTAETTNGTDKAAKPAQRITVAGTPPTVDKVVSGGNRVAIHFTGLSLNLTKENLWYKIILTGVSTPNAAGVTGPLKLTLVNEATAPTKIYTSFDNLNSQYYSQINSASSALLNWNRGFNFSFSDVNKSVINFNTNNRVTVSPGRYKTNLRCYFSSRSPC